MGGLTAARSGMAPQALFQHGAHAYNQFIQSSDKRHPVQTDTVGVWNAGGGWVSIFMRDIDRQQKVYQALQDWLGQSGFRTSMGQDSSYWVLKVCVGGRALS
jgi:hypothetical protein